MQGHQRGEIGEVRVDGGEPAEQPMGEADGIVVAVADLHPDEGQLGMGGGPLGEENRLAGTGRCHNEGEGAGQCLVQPSPQCRPVHRVGRPRKCCHHISALGRTPAATSPYVTSLSSRVGGRHRARGHGGVPPRSPFGDDDYAVGGSQDVGHVDAQHRSEARTIEGVLERARATMSLLRRWTEVRNDDTQIADTSTSERANLDATRFEIVVKGRLSPTLTAAIEGFEVSRCDRGLTHLVGWVSDQARLHGTLELLRDLNIELVSVNSMPSPETGTSGRQGETTRGNSHG
jgi:hypothetical protein